MVSLLCAPLLLLAQEAQMITAEPASLLPANDRIEQPEELGQVRWRRDFDAALLEAQETDKPVLILFQEVPG